MIITEQDDLVTSLTGTNVGSFTLNPPSTVTKAIPASIHPSLNNSVSMTNYLLLKVVSKGGEKEKIFTLCYVNTGGDSGCEQLKDLIRMRLNKDIAADFNVGHFKGQNILGICIATGSDISNAIFCCNHTEGN